MRRRVEDSCRSFSEPRGNPFPNNADAQRQVPKEGPIDSGFDRASLKPREHRTAFSQKWALINASRCLTSLHIRLGDSR